MLWHLNNPAELLDSEEDRDAQAEAHKRPKCPSKARYLREAFASVKVGLIGSDLEIIMQYTRRAIFFRREVRSDLGKHREQFRPHSSQDEACVNGWGFIDGFLF